MSIMLPLGSGYSHDIRPVLCPPDYSTIGLDWHGGFVTRSVLLTLMFAIAQQARNWIFASQGSAKLTFMPHSSVIPSSTA